MNIWGFLAAAAERAPDGTALVQSERSWSYGQAHGDASRLATGFARHGARGGERVACLMQNSAEHYLAYFAAACTGAILVSLNTRLAPAEIRAILDDACVRLLVHDDEHADLARAAAAGTAIAVCDCAQLASPHGEMHEPEPTGGSDTAHLYYTSGTTGRPKGVMLTHDNVCIHALTAASELDLTATDRWAHIAPMFHLADAWAVFAITHTVGTHVFLPKFSPVAALDLLAAERITITNLVPTMLTLMVADQSAAARGYSLRAMLSGGAPIAAEVVRRIVETFDCDYVQTYGMTETSPYLTLGLLSEELRRLPADEQLVIKCRTGRPFRGVELQVIGDDGREVPRDDRTVGEIRVRGDTVTSGYWRNKAATTAAFDGDGFLRTGDLATIDAHGYVNIVDRKKDVIKTGGEAVYSTEVEQVLYRHPAVLECAVYGEPDAVWGEIVAAAIVLRPGGSATADDLIAFCRDAIAHYKAPRRVRFLDELPKTGSGKIQKIALRRR